LESAVGKATATTGSGIQASAGQWQLHLQHHHRLLQVFNFSSGALTSEFLGYLISAATAATAAKQMKHER